MNLRVLIVVTFRPEFMAPWVGRATSPRLAQPFGRNHAVAMIDADRVRKSPSRRSARSDRGEDRRRAAVRGGLTKSVLESGLLRENTRPMSWPPR